jgi:hypothetical protein
VCVCVCVCVCVWVCVCGGGSWTCACLRAWSLTYPVCNAHAPYCHLGPLWLLHIFLHCLIKGTIFVKNVTEHKMCVSLSLTTFIWNISHYKKNLATYYEYVNIVMWNTRCSCRILMKLEFSRQIFENSWNSNLFKILILGAGLFHAGGRTQIYRQTRRS